MAIFNVKLRVMNTFVRVGNGMREETGRRGNGGREEVLPVVIPEDP
jgi:hypothetical protein